MSSASNGTNNLTLDPGNTGLSIASDQSWTVAAGRTLTLSSATILKAGAFDLTLTGTDARTGATMVDGGTLLVTGGGKITRTLAIRP